MFCLHMRMRGLGLAAASAHPFGTLGRRVLPIRLILAHPSTSRRYHPSSTFTSSHKRFFASSSALRAPPPPSPLSQTPSPSPTRHSILSRLLPASLLPNVDGASSTSASFRKIVALARPERRPLLTAIGLLLVSSSVSLSIPFTVGKLIDYFTSPNPVCWSL